MHLPYRSVALVGLAVVLGTAACSSERDDVSVATEQVSRLGRDLHEATRCTDTCVAGAYCPGDMEETFGVCSGERSLCCAPARDMSWTKLFNLAPMLAEVETNATMQPVPGRQNGVFIEYASGGRWHLQWTCDVATTSEGCVLGVQAQTSEAVTDVDSSTFPAGTDVETSSNGVQVVTTTSSEIHELSFTTKPGAEVMVNVFDLTSSHKTPHETLIFLMQGGKTNGGFTGKLSNPLRVKPTAP